MRTIVFVETQLQIYKSSVKIYQELIPCSNRAGDILINVKMFAAICAHKFWQLPHRNTQRERERESWRWKRKSDPGVYPDMYKGIYSENSWIFLIYRRAPSSLFRHIFVVFLTATKCFAFYENEKNFPKFVPKWYIKLEGTYFEIVLSHNNTQVHFSHGSNKSLLKHTLELTNS